MASAPTPPTSPTPPTTPATVDIREIPTGQTDRATAALLALRPRWGDADTIVAAVDGRLRPRGYRLVGVFARDAADAQSAAQADAADAQAGAQSAAQVGAGAQDGDQALAVAGFREVDALAWGHHLYVDDVSTRPEHRGAGHGDRLVRWLVEEAVRLGCESLQLDSGVGPDREAAHRLYLRNHLRISAHHFYRDLTA